MKLGEPMPVETEKVADAWLQIKLWESSDLLQIFREQALLKSYAREKPFRSWIIFDPRPRFTYFWLRIRIEARDFGRDIVSMLREMRHDFREKFTPWARKKRARFLSRHQWGRFRGY